MNKTNRLAFIKARAAVVSSGYAAPITGSDTNTTNEVNTVGPIGATLCGKSDAAVLLSPYERNEVARQLGRQPKSVIFIAVAVVVESKEEDSEVIDITPREVPEYKSIIDRAHEAYAKAYVAFWELIEQAPLKLN